MNLWTVHASALEYDNDPRMPGNSNVGWREYVVADSQADALKQCEAEINIFNNKSTYTDKEVIAEIVTIENLLVCAKNPKSTKSGGYYTQKSHEVKLTTPGWKLTVQLEKI